LKKSSDAQFVMPPRAIAYCPKTGSGFVPGPEPDSYPERQAFTPATVRAQPPPIPDGLSLRFLPPFRHHAFLSPFVRNRLSEQHNSCLRRGRCLNECSSAFQDFESLPPSIPPPLRPSLMPARPSAIARNPVRCFLSCRPCPSPSFLKVTLSSALVFSVPRFDRFVILPGTTHR